MRVLLAVDGSPHSDIAVEEVPNDCGLRAQAWKCSR
jgi:hypothetical protein